MSDVERKLDEMGIELQIPKPVANYVPAVKSGRLLFVSGCLPVKDGKLLVSGRLGEEVDVEKGVECARLCGLNLLAYAKSLLGDLNLLKRVLRVEVFVAASKTFSQHSTVANGVSDLLAEIFGEDGRHSRIAVGVESLPLNAPVEVSAVFEIEDLNER